MSNSTSSTDGESSLTTSKTKTCLTPEGTSATPVTTTDAEECLTIRIKVVTYNVYYGSWNNKATLDTISSFDADIVALQETNTKWQTSIENHPDISTKFKYICWAHDTSNQVN